MIRRFAVAPMIDWTDRHCRFFHRLLSQHALLYTEMITTGAILHGDRERCLGFNPQEHPVALQLGGNQPQALAECAAIGADYGYDEINLNVGCPSDRVQNGRFGACLMAEPELVARCVATMRARVSIPVTVKTRLGIDHYDDYAFLKTFIEHVAQAGCEHVILHARTAWLKGLSPKENRDIPPLQYDKVYRLKHEFSKLNISINGGIKDFEQADQHLSQVDGVMLGRAIYHNPYLLTEVDRRYYGATTPPQSRADIITQLLPYLEHQLALTGRIEHVTRHIIGLWHSLPGSRHLRQQLSDNTLSSTEKFLLIKTFA